MGMSEAWPALYPTNAMLPSSRLAWSRPSPLVRTLRQISNPTKNRSLPLSLTSGYNFQVGRHLLMVSKSS